MPRIVRRRPLLERITAAINPWDFFLWLSEEIETRDIGSKSLGTQLGLGMNFVFLVARANGRYSGESDDVFSESSGLGWFTYLSWTFAWMMAGISTWNLVYTFWRSRAYRLFEADIDQAPATPSAHRVRVQSSPVASSPMRFLTDILSESAESRAHPDKTRDVWELRVWDPLPASLQLVCLFSPLHVLIYMLSLPLPPLEHRPSVIVFKCIIEQVALSGLLLMLEAKFSQQNKDSALVQKWVMREYDIKFVHPRLHPIVRDVGTQCGEDDSGHDADFVEIGTPTTMISRTFQTNPNNNYAKHYDPDNIGQAPPSRSMSPPVFTPKTRPRQSDLFALIQRSRPSPLRQSMPAQTPQRPVAPTTAMTNAGTSMGTSTRMGTGTSTGTNFGGNLGVHTHANSPLKKAISMNEMFSPRNSREMAAMEQRDLAERMQRRSSPLKESRRSIPPSNAQPLDPGPSPNPFANMGNHRNRYERFPSRW